MLYKIWIGTIISVYLGTSIILSQDLLLDVITIENVPSLVELDHILEKDHFFSDIAFRPNSDEFATIAVANTGGLFHDGEILFFDSFTLTALSKFDPSIKGISIAYSSDGLLLAVGNGIGDDLGRLRILNLETSEIILDQMIDNAEIRDVVFSPSQNYVAVALGNAQVIEQEFGFIVIEVKTKNTIFSISETHSFDIDFLDDSTLLVSTYMNRMSVIQVWDFVENYLMYQADDAFTIGSDVIALDNQTFIYEAQRGVISANYVEDHGEKIILEQIPRNFIRTIAVHPTQPLLAVGYERQLQTDIPGDRDGVIGLWHVDNQVELNMLEEHSDMITDLAFSPDGTLLASGGADGTVRLWGIPAEE